mgnify:CR=1 FL=1
MDQIIEFNKKDMSITCFNSNTANKRYPLNVLEILYTDGSVEVDKDIELFIEGCYHPSIVLTLDK